MGKESSEVNDICATMSSGTEPLMIMPIAPATPRLMAMGTPSSMQSSSVPMSIQTISVSANSSTGIVISAAMARPMRKSRAPVSRYCRTRSCARRMLISRNATTSTE